MSVDLKKIGTEQRNQNTMDLDTLSTADLVRVLNKEDQSVAFAVEKASGQIAKVVDEIVKAFLNGGRLLYMGAGTSGRLGILDAVECGPTYSVSDDMVQCLMAGGMKAMVKAVEGAEDSIEFAIEDLKSVNLRKEDIVIGITASGRTPYAVGGVKFAKDAGCVTACITTSPNSEIAATVDFPIEAITGAEPVTGSTRMKSGTAQKMILNMLSTASMVKMGKVYGNLMVDVQATNQKLVQRARSIVCQATGVTNEEATAAIEKYGSVKKAVFALLSGEEDKTKVERILDENHGHLKNSLAKVRK